MKVSIKIKNRVVEINTESQITDIEMSHIESIIAYDIERLEKKTPDTITVLTTLLAEYALKFYLKDREIKQLKEYVERKIDELVEKAKELNRDSSYF